MYLVLTALLALNVSKQILDAFVAIEENIQRSSEASQNRGQEVINGFDGALITAQSTNDQATIRRIKQCVAWIKDVDKSVDEFIKLSDKLKIDMIKAVEGDEKLKAANPDKGGPILLEESNYKGPNFLKPHKLNLFAIDKQDDFDKPMAVLGLHEIAEVKKGTEGMKLWESYLKVRNDLVTKAGTYTDFKGQKWTLKISPKDHINDFESSEKLGDAIKNLFTSKGNKLNPSGGDLATLLEVYQSLTKKEYAKYHEEEKKIHWVGRTFDHAPLVGAIASISSLQNEVLAARLKVINLIKQRQSGGEFSFNSIAPLVKGPGVATAGDEIELEVTMGAYNSDQNPVIKTSQGPVTYEEGKGKIKLRVGSGDMTVKGTVSIKNSQQTAFEKNWEWPIKVVQSSGSISIPAYSVLFTEWDNFIIPVATGVITTNVTAKGATIRKATQNGKQGYIVRVTGGGTATLFLTGTDASGKPKNFGSWSYKVKQFPRPVCALEKVSKSSNTRIRVSLGPSSILGDIEFKVTGYSYSIGGELIRVNGDVIGPGQLSKFKPGSKIPLTISASRAGLSPVPIQHNFTVTN